MSAEPQPRLRSFVAVACALVALLFADAFSGRVLSQTDILFDYSPWFEQAPAEPVASNGQRPGNRWLGDMPTFVYPNLELTRKALRELRFPIWNPDMYAGQPFLASYQTGLLSPFVLLSALFPPADALLAHAVARLLVGGIGMFLFLRGLGLGRAAVWFGGLSFLLNPFTLVWLEHPPSAVSCWLPWLLWAVDRTRRHGGPGNVALLAGLTAIALLAGHPETAFKGFLLAGAYALGVGLAGTHRGRWRADAVLLLGRLLPAVLLGTALAAAQIVPFAEYMGESGIAAMRRTFAASPMVAPAQAAAAAFVPDAYGNPSRGHTLAIPNTNYLEQTVYPGNVAWVLAAVAVAIERRRRWRVAVLGCAALLAAALMYGVPGLSHLFVLIPMAGLSAPSRFGLIVIFAVMAMGAIGVHAMSEADRPAGSTRAARTATVALALMTAIVASIVWWQWVLFSYSAFVPDLTRAVLWSGAIAGGAAGIVIGWAKGLLPPRIAIVLLTVLSVGDLFAIGFRFHPMLPRSQVFPTVPSIELIRGDRTLYRVAGFGKSLPPNTAMVYGLADPRGYDGVAPRHFTDLLGRAFGPGMAHQVDRTDALPVLDLLNVKYLIGSDERDAPPASHWVTIASAPVPVYRNDGVFPRAWLVDRVVVLDEPATLDWIVAPASDLRRVAPVPEAQPPGDQPEPAAARGMGDVTIARYEPTTVELTTNAPGRRLLVLADAWYPGWQVSVDGRKAAVVRAYHALRAVPVPAGQHVVRFAYEPASLTIGLAISGAALVVLGTLVALAWRQRPQGADRLYD